MYFHQFHWFVIYPNILIGQVKPANSLCIIVHIHIYIAHTIKRRYPIHPCIPQLYVKEANRMIVIRYNKSWCISRTRRLASPIDQHWNRIWQCAITHKSFEFCMTSSRILVWIFQHNLIKYHIRCTIDNWLKNIAEKAWNCTKHHLINSLTLTGDTIE